MKSRAFSENALLSCTQMARCDRWTIDQGITLGIALMETAGRAVVDGVADLFAGGGPVHILCGPGNNGGDGYVAARRLAARGRDVHVYALGPPKPGKDAHHAAQRCTGPVHPLEAFCAQDGQGLVIDALFGAGFRGALPAVALDALTHAKAQGMARLAVDVPSGLAGDSGLCGHGIAFDATVTFFRKKPGHVSGAGPDLCGRLILADIGVQAPPDLIPAAFENAPALWQADLPRRGRGTHKYRQGHVAVFSGPPLQTGAARLCAQAAARAGAGAVTLLGSDAALGVHAAQVSSIMLRPYAVGEAGAALDSLNGVSAVALGPGFGDLAEARAIAQACFTRALPLVLDADGITAFAADPAALWNRPASSPLILTPHHGEFARLFPDLAADHTMGKLTKTQAAAQRVGAVVLYKGADTVVAGPDALRPPVINTHATPALATAGSGDVLAGVIAGLLAQGMGGAEAACAGAWLHGEAGRRAGPICIAEDLVDALKPVCGEMYGGHHPQP